ncbi:MAG TPA: pyridoxamine 5'-phosphate oxidase family protein [Nitriliruptorales bacterium]|nr:pyridoxamine 5'-phosphate oxidase family protein [Nitriliruptorales bacterium]
MVHAAIRGAVVAFEIDAFDRATRTGWKRDVVGEASVVTDPQELRRIERLGLEPWVGDAGWWSRWIRIPVVHVSGRRIPMHV